MHDRLIEYYFYRMKLKSLIYKLQLQITLFCHFKSFKAEPNFSNLADFQCKQALKLQEIVILEAINRLNSSLHFRILDSLKIFARIADGAECVREHAKKS